MQAAEFNEWDFYPVNLPPNEVNNPLDVFAAFFYDDWLPGQLERLKQWRDYVLPDKYYLDMKKSPFGLLYFHKLNICLIEAAHLLKETTGLSTCEVEIANLAKEKSTWRDYPVNLSNAELIEPHSVICEFFKVYNLPQYRAHLYEWLEYGLSAKAANEFIETVDLIRVYESLQKLYSAAWLITQRASREPYLNENAVESHSTDLPEQVKLYKLYNRIEPRVQELVGKIIAIIKHKLSSVQAILYLGVPSGMPEKIYLLILTSNDEQRLAQSLSSMIEESCQDIAGIVALVQHASSLFTGLENGHMFFNEALTSPVIYLSGDIMLPVAGIKSSNTNANGSAFKWERWQSQGCDFLSGAEHYLGKQAYNAALFSLHQCAECLLIAVIRVVFGYRVNNHNLSRLLKITEMFTNDLSETFNLDDDANAKLFDSLKHAYVNVRYKDDYEASPEAVMSLLQTIKKLERKAAGLYRAHLLTSSL